MANKGQLKTMQDTRRYRQQYQTKRLTLAQSFSRL